MTAKEELQRAQYRYNLANQLDPEDVKKAAEALRKAQINFRLSNGDEVLK